jgi:hypothetical protein
MPVQIPNYGLLSGIANGVNSFMNAYQTAKGIKHQQKMQELLAGVTEDEQGNMALTPEKQQEKELQRGLIQSKIEELNPRSKALKEELGMTAGYKAIKDENGNVIGREPDYAYLTAKGNSTFGGGRGADLRTDKQAAEATNRIHNDKDITQMRGQANAIYRGMHLISDPNNPPSVTAMHEIAQDFASALNNGKVSSDFKLKSISTPTLQENMRKLESFITSNPNQPAPPEVVRFWKDMGSRLNDAYKRQMGARASTITKELGTVYKHNQQARDAAAAAAQSYIDGSWINSGEEQPQEAAPMGMIGNAPKSAGPKEGDTKEWQGKTYKVIGGHWVAQ